ncbi:PaaD-like zinc ribbon domain-containing protein [Haladaptatus caseinilyticus]
MSTMNDPTTQEEFTPTCPFCMSTNVKQESAFGSEISKAQYYCDNCQTMFERLKYDGKRPDTNR